ncbi:MAG TPA: OmpH family outer membrane protein [Candidatus Babeliales bacterium]|nr:OmpH family outer membrane protein [Candidatus Babeliales bacterium]
MKKFLSLALLTATISTVSLAEAPKVSMDKDVASLKTQVSKLAKQQVKIGIVSATDVAGAEESKDLQKDIMQLRAKYEGAVMKIDQELQGLVAQAQSAAQAKLKSKVEDLQEKITQKTQERETAAKNAERGMQRDAQKLVQESQERFLQAVEKVANAKGLDVVMQRETVLYVNPASESDITKAVISEWDSIYKAIKAKKASAKPVLKK